MMIRGGNVRRRAGFGLIAAGAVTLAVGAGITAAGSGRAYATAQPTGSFSTISAPLTGAVDYITDLPGPACGDKGPVGLLDTGTTFYVSDFCDATLRAYPVGSTVPLTASASVKNGLTDGLTDDNGLFLGLAGGQSVVPPGIYSFDPTTLALGKLLMASPCGATTRDLVTDPATGDLLATGTCGLYRISGITSGHPVSTQLNGDDLDGLTVGGSGANEVFWTADLNVSGITEFSSTGTAITSIAIPGGADGLAVAGPNAAAGIAGNLFVNDNDGSITMVDLHNSNALSTVASGGTRGDFVTVGPDGYLYATQRDRVEQIQPPFFVPVGTPPTTKPTTPASPTSATSAATSTSTSGTPSQTPASHASSTTHTAAAAAKTSTPAATSSAVPLLATSDPSTSTPLPDTGSDPLPWVAIALLLLVGGVFLVVRQRGHHE